MKKLSIFIIIPLLFLCCGSAFAKDQMVIIYNDGSSQKVVLSKPVSSIKSINYNGAISAKIHRRIVVVAGTYGNNCGAPYGNKTADLVKACNGKKHCDYIIDANVIGDPVDRCSKDYIAEWKCGEDTTLHTSLAPPEAGFKTKIILLCP